MPQQEVLYVRQCARAALVVFPQQQLIGQFFISFYKQINETKKQRKDDQCMHFTLNKKKKADIFR